MRNRVIWKFVFVDSGLSVQLPMGAMVRFGGLDPATGLPALWVELDPEAERAERRFRIYGTGHEIEGDGGYPYDIHVASLIQDAFVWHIYEQRAA